MQTSRARMSRLALMPVLVLVLALGAVVPLRAQEAAGRIVGVITDQQGGLIAGARVTVLNTETRATRETTTDKEGLYQVLALPPGE